MGRLERRMVFPVAIFGGKGKAPNSLSLSGFRFVSFRFGYVKKIGHK